MNTFKRKALFAAVLGRSRRRRHGRGCLSEPQQHGPGPDLSRTTPCNPPGGNAWNTYISVVNTTSVAKAVKVRILEGKTSAEVLDFNLFLSPNDMWIGGHHSGRCHAAGAAWPPDHRRTMSCTNPAIPTAGVDFRNFQYSDAAAPMPCPARPSIAPARATSRCSRWEPSAGATATAVTHSSLASPPTARVVQVPALHRRSRRPDQSAQRAA